MSEPRADTARTMARGYGSVVAAAAVFLLIALLVQPVDRAQEELTAGPGALAGPTQDTTAAGQPAAGVTRVQTSAGTAGSAGNAGGGGGVAAPSACADRPKQVPGDPYSPPCAAFAGNNGGSTAKGVTKDSIIVSVRQLEGPSAGEIFADITGENVNDSPQAYKDTVLAYAEYFNKRFQLYGRKIKIKFFDGQGIGANELLGGGRETALADALQASQEIGAFADITGITLPYADALARQKVVNFGAPYPSRKWFQDRDPYTWSLFPDGTNVTEASSSWIIARLKSSKVVQYAPDFNGKPRVYGIVAPENPEYQESVARYVDLLTKAGIKIAVNLKYKLDISTMVNQASGIVAQLKDRGVTSVICACDPVMLALGMTPKSNEQSYNPEWLTSGLAFVEQDLVGQLIDPKQWQHAFGIAYNAKPEPLGASYPYAAYKQIRPNDEPSFGFEEVYYQMYLLAIGLQMAGPNLNPQSFRNGMFAYPGGFGPRGTWGFGPGDYTPTNDFREIWWSTKAISTQNNKPGAWIELNGGKRYLPGQIPSGSAPYFK